MIKGLIMIHTLTDLIKQTDGFDSKMSLSTLPASEVLRFSNTGDKYFDISIIALHQTLIDIERQISEFLQITTYIEADWRSNFSEYLTDPAVNAMSTVQTLPLYTVINKVLCAINNLEFEPKKLPLTAANLKNAIDFLSSQINVVAPVSYVRKILSTSSTPHSDPGQNIIYYGAPGTGKSHEIDEATTPLNSIRTVFHPDTQNSDFVGCLKPSMGESGIEYSYKHGPFIEALVKALNDPAHHYYLVIEEINRAPAAAVFGEIFQLLDRIDNGQSKYTIDISDKDLLGLLNSELETPLSNNKLLIPRNLSIYATMNSSDQAVLPLDTAFKRRWKFKYKAISFEDKNGNQGCPKGTIEFQTQNGAEKIEWAVLAQTINKILSAESIPEDRHLGPWFISQNELDSSAEAQESFTGKILMYLWDDVLRHSETSKLFHKDIKTFGGLISAHENNKLIFSEKFYSILEETYPIKTTATSTTSSDEVQEENTVDA